MNDTHKIGFMQGRLSPMIDGRIQSFPWLHWQQEFALAEQADIHLMEWTLDQERLSENPLMTRAGQTEIKDLCARHHLSIPSLTGDCFMQAPFWKAEGSERDALQQDFISIAKSCHTVGITMIVVPLVDNGRLENMDQEDILIAFLNAHVEFLVEHNLCVIFESDFAPQELARFIERLPAPVFGINYDIGNSAALGFDPKQEFQAYGPRIINVHVKDRVLGGTTVPLGDGAADFPTVFTELAKQNYAANYILQTARSATNHHQDVLCAYRDMVLQWRHEQASAIP